METLTPREPCPCCRQHAPVVQNQSRHHVWACTACSYRRESGVLHSTLVGYMHLGYRFHSGAVISLGAALAFMDEHQIFRPTRHPWFEQQGHCSYMLEEHLYCIVRRDQRWPVCAISQQHVLPLRETWYIQAMVGPPVAGSSPGLRVSAP